MDKFTAAERLSEYFPNSRWSAVYLALTLLERVRYEKDFRMVY